LPYFLYSLEELRCDLTAYREAVRIQRRIEVVPDAELGDEDRTLLEHATMVQYAILFDRIFRFALTGSRVRNYDGLGGQLLFAWLHQRRVLHWTDTKLTIDWPDVADQVLALGSAIEELYWRSIDRPKIAHWLAAYELVSATLTPNPASQWARGAAARAHGCGARRRVPALDVLRGAAEEARRRHRVDRGHHGVTVGRP
jgi:hypothetical protein